MKTRRDHETARVIDASIEILEWDGMYLAARMLYEYGVRFETTLRVLRLPDQRRTCGTALIH